MFTLKVLFADGTKWIPGVTRITQCGVACLGDDPQPEDRRQACDAILDLFPGPAKRWRGHIHVDSYPNNTWLTALVVDFADDSEATYIVPRENAYLLGPDGATIDRL